MEPQRTQKSQSDPEEGERTGGISLPDFNTTLRSYSHKKVWNWHKNRHTEQRNRTESPGINLQVCGQLFTRKEPRTYTRERTVPSINGAGKTGRHTPKKNTALCLHHVQKGPKTQFSTSSPSPPGSSEDRHPQRSATHRNLLPTFPHLFPQGYHLPAGPEETRLLSERNGPHDVPKLKPQRVLRRPGFR